MDTDEFERRGGFTVFEAKLDGFPHSFHESVEIFRLRVASSQRRHGGDVVVVFVSFDNNCEFPLSFHVLILARARRARIPPQTADPSLREG